MKFEYEINKKIQKKILNSLHFKYNLIYFSLFTIFYFLVNAYAMKFNFLLVFFSYLLYSLLFILVVLIMNTIYNALYLKKQNIKLYGTYKFSIDKEEIKEEVNDITYIVKLKEIKKIKVYKKYITIKTNDNIRISYFKFLLKDNYDKLILYLNDNNLI